MSNTSWVSPMDNTIALSALHLRVRLLAFLLWFAACAQPPSVRFVESDPEVLRGVLASWQEGPTDGNLCLDQRVLAQSGRVLGAVRWAPQLLESLSTDPRISIDTSHFPLPTTALRGCGPRQYRTVTLLAQANPSSDTFVTLTGGWHSSDTTPHILRGAQIGRIGGRWRHVGWTWVESLPMERLPAP